VRKTLILLLVLAGLAGVIASGCVPSEVVIVYKSPPPRYEKPPVCPGPVYIWIPGHWAWRPRPGKYMWIPGHWAKRPPGKVWAPGHWKKYRGGWVWICGDWK